MQKLAGAIRFAELLDAKLSAQVQALRASDAVRAKALEQEVPFYARKTCKTCRPSKRSAPTATWRWKC